MTGLFPALLRLLVVSAVASGSGACALVQARTAPVEAPLDVPPPPPRTAMVPTPDPTPATEPAVAPPAEPIPPVPRPAEPAARIAPTTREPSPQTTAPAAPPPAPNLTLRPGGASTSTVSVEEVMTLIGRASKSLDAVPRHRLNEASRTQYDAARRFLAQAQAAVKVDNLVFARFLAEKAETLAKGLR